MIMSRSQPINARMHSNTMRAILVTLRMDRGYLELLCNKNMYIHL